MTYGEEFRAMRKPWILMAALCCGACATLPDNLARNVAISTRAVGLGAQQQGRERVGALRYLGGLMLTSSDPHFGGLSSMRWDRGRLGTMSDEGGSFYAFEPVEKRDRLVGVRKARATRLRGANGAPFVGKEDTDTESMDLNTPTGAHRPRTVSFGFERHDRILTYSWRHGLPVGTPHALHAAQSWFGRQPYNLGVESMAGNRQLTLMVSEGLKRDDGTASALLFRPGVEGASDPAEPEEIGIPAPGDARPSELVLVDDGHFIMLRRSWSEKAGFAVEVDWLALTRSPQGRTTASIKPIAHFAPPILTDNYEGAAIRRRGKHLYLYLISDDNFEAGQRTLLLKFELDRTLMEAAAP
jgi:hypothetical protein